MKVVTTKILTLGERIIGSITTKKEYTAGTGVIWPERRSGFGKKRIKKSSIFSDEMLQDAFGSVEAAVIAKLGQDDQGKTGETPFNYGEMGGSDTSANSLKILNERGIPDEVIARKFLERRGQPGTLDNPDLVMEVVSALRSIRGATPIRRK